MDYYSTLNEVCFALFSGTENSCAARWAEQRGPAQHLRDGRWKGDSHLHFRGGLQTNHGGHGSHRYTGKRRSRCTQTVLACLCVCQWWFLIDLLRVGDSGALYVAEGQTPTSGEAEGGEQEGARAAEGAEEAPEPTAPGYEIFRGS